MKSWLQSQTIRNALLSFTILVGGIAIDSFKSKEFKQEYLYTLGGGAYALLKTIEGRAKANTPIYTPAGLPGPNKPPSESINDKIASMAQAANDFERSQSLEQEILKLDIPDSEQESRSNGEANELEIIGLRSLGKKYKLTFIHDSKIKDSLDDSATLTKDSILEVSKGEIIEIHFYKRDVANHIKVQFTEGGLEYFAYIPHLELTNGKGEKVSLVDHVVVKSAPTNTPAVKKTSYTLPNGSAVYLEDPVLPGLSTHWHEVTKNGTRYLSNMDQVSYIKTLATFLEQVRDHFKAPLVYTSFFRDRAANNACGGSSQSVHLTAGAADFYLPGISEQRVYDYVESLGWSGGLAIDPGVFTHVDISGLLPQDALRLGLGSNVRVPSGKSYRRWSYS